MNKTAPITIKEADIYGAFPIKAITTNDEKNVVDKNMRRIINNCWGMFERAITLPAILLLRTISPITKHNIAAIVSIL